MATYIDRDELATLRNEEIGDSTVRIRTRLVGGTAVVDLTEFTPEGKRPVSKTKLVGVVRSEGKANVVKPRAVGDPIADSEIVRDRNRLDKNGHVVTDRLRIRSLTYVVVPR